ncbi:MAG: asparagine synthase (glutamine-hydrolyzing), partial [Planctomycetota bacterium]
MCGFGGILRTDGKQIPPAWLSLIDRRVAYRGPDGGGRFEDRVEFEEAGETRVIEIGLVHRRLAIIDLEDGHQPMVSEHGRDEGEGLVAVVFNGCIYNHRDLRAELERCGRRFETDHSDTEVLLHGYREWGAELTERLEGMYAFALWDRTRGSLVLGRDWFGEKPLYLRQGIGDNEQVIAFGSDARSLARLTTDPLPRPQEPDIQLWTDTYLQLGYSPAGSSVYGSERGDGVEAVPPTILEKIDDLLPRWPRETHDLDDFERLLDAAVARRLEADVPLGCFLSGGVDSSLIAHYARVHQPDVTTYTVRMPHELYDESPYAEQVAEHLGVRHHTLDVAPEPAEDLVHLVRTLGQPFGDSSILPTYWVSKAARQHVKVALSGDGGDELFIGYERYMAARHLARHRRILRWMPRSLMRDSEPKSMRHKIGRLGEMARDMPHLGILAMESLFSRRQMVELLGGLPQRKARQPRGFDPMQSLRRADLMNYLPNDLLVKVDTASMAVGLEVRAPFLDRELVRAALAAPTYQLVTKGRRKAMLR